MDDVVQKEIEEAILLYLDIYKKALLEIEQQILAELYNKLDDRRLSTLEEDKHIKIQELLTICGAISGEEMHQCLEVANKTIFWSKHMHINLMVGRVNEIVKETNEAWVQLFFDNHGFFTSPDIPPKFDIPEILVNARGKGILGEDPLILDEKITEDIPLALTNVQYIEENDPIDNIEDNFLPIIDVMA